MSRADSERFRSRSRARKIARRALRHDLPRRHVDRRLRLDSPLRRGRSGAIERPAGDGEGLATSIGVAALPRYLATLADRFQSVQPDRAGFKAGLAGSLWLLAMVALFAIPVGVGAAVSLEEFAPAGRWKRIVQTNIANLAGVPSIVYGILGLALFARGFGVKHLALGPTLLSGGLTLGLLVLPIIVIATQEALAAVPISLRQAALALGATRWQVVRDHVLPNAAPGILTGTILSLSRDRRDRASSLGRRGRIDLVRPSRTLRSLHRPARRNLQLRERSRPRLSRRRLRRNSHPPRLALGNERRGDRDPK